MPRAAALGLVFELLFTDILPVAVVWTVVGNDPSANDAPHLPLATLLTVSTTPGWTFCTIASAFDVIACPQSVQYTPVGMLLRKFEVFLPEINDVTSVKVTCTPVAFCAADSVLGTQYVPLETYFVQTKSRTPLYCPMTTLSALGINWPLARSVAQPLRRVVFADDRSLVVHGDDVHTPELMSMSARSCEIRPTTKDALVIQLLSGLMMLPEEVPLHTQHKEERQWCRLPTSPCHCC